MLIKKPPYKNYKRPMPSENSILCSPCLSGRHEDCTAEITNNPTFCLCQEKGHKVSHDPACRKCSLCDRAMDAHEYCIDEGCICMICGEATKAATSTPDNDWPLSKCNRCGQPITKKQYDAGNHRYLGPNGTGPEAHARCPKGAVKSRLNHVKKIIAEDRKSNEE